MWKYHSWDFMGLWMVIFQNWSKKSMSSRSILGFRGNKRSSTIAMADDALQAVPVPNDDPVPPLANESEVQDLHTAWQDFMEAGAHWPLDLQSEKNIRCLLGVCPNSFCPSQFETQICERYHFKIETIVCFLGEVWDPCFIFLRTGSQETCFAHCPWKSCKWLVLHRGVVVLWWRCTTPLGALQLPSLGRTLRGCCHSSRTHPARRQLAGYHHFFSQSMLEPQFTMQQKSFVFMSRLKYRG